MIASVLFRSCSRRPARVAATVLLLATLLASPSGHDRTLSEAYPIGFPGLAENELVGGKWTWWACAILAAGTIVTCYSGNIVSCVVMVVSYSQNC